MPELPSLEIFKQYFNSTSLHQKIKEINVHNPEILVNITENDLKEFLNRYFVSSSRYGKYLFASSSDSTLSDNDLIEDKFLVFHFGMTGFFKYHSFNEGFSPHSRISFVFEKGNVLDFEDPRKFGKISISENISDFINKKNLGPDALEIDLPSFKKLLQKRKGQIKPLLMNQQFLAGIGNLYADEILFQSGIHPLKKANQIENGEQDRLYNNMVWVLKKAIEFNDSPCNFPENFLLAHRYPKGECPNGKKLDIITVGGRTTYYCPGRQKL